MNEFTKEELQQLWHMCGSECDYIIRDVSRLSNSEGTENVRQFYVGLLNQLHGMQLKFKFLIDNYCQHEWDNEYSGSIHRGIYCRKCSMKLKGS